MKLCVLLMALGLAVSVNASADENKEQSNAVQQLKQQEVDASKVNANQAEEEVTRQHDVLKNQFLGRRPYMETKVMESKAK
ncbi:hypothetical protein [Methylotenera mobilis]|uniref:Uncharacterized protein n=1 Tax=Methylotenera mobilis (strain JLW8 / ATCC BAA-1282 / DSM 17540) TaxID=583345 RepID=C6WTQ3_METML|nr:hypothetical protein [Methylotenera mobilis]ACT49194.1 hypothetical protein Mmol_2292 [Methylotenera mobilis JLW8]